MVAGILLERHCHTARGERLDDRPRVFLDASHEVVAGASLSAAKREVRSLQLLCGLVLRDVVREARKPEYPGLGLGVIASTAKVVNQTLLSAAAHALGGIVNPDQPGAAVLPFVDKLTEFSEHLAIVVAQNAIQQGITKKKINNAQEAVRQMKWVPKYTV